METDRGVRRLTVLDHSASTARVLNLMAAHRRSPEDEELQRRPFFKNRQLNHSIILKHRLRPHEYAHFSNPRATMTKVLLPIDGADLRSGAHTFFIGEGGFGDMADHTFGEDLKPGSRDRRLLELLDQLPSLDPFLLREHLRAHDIEPARGYFSISEADVQRMVEFVREEILGLVILSTGQKQGSTSAAARLVEKLLSNSPEADFEPLRHTLGLSGPAYLDGVFAWRGFLYYKWVLTDLAGPLNAVVNEILTTHSRGPKSVDAQMYIAAARDRLKTKLLQAHAGVRQLLDVYERAYQGLVSQNEPGRFRDFLVAAPAMFVQLGEQLGAVQHVVSFWNFRMPRGRPRVIDHDELADLFLDFEDSLSGIGGGEAAAHQIHVAPMAQAL